MRMPMLQEREDEVEEKQSREKRKTMLCHATPSTCKILFWVDLDANRETFFPTPSPPPPSPSPPPYPPKSSIHVCVHPCRPVHPVTCARRIVSLVFLSFSFFFSFPTRHVMLSWIPPPVTCRDATGSWINQDGWFLVLGRMDVSHHLRRTRSIHLYSCSFMDGFFPSPVVSSPGTLF